MSDGIARADAGVPSQPVCAACSIGLTEPFGWCSNCQASYCLDCGRGHFCRPACHAAGCVAGLCVRLVTDGRLSSRWGSPDASGDPLTTGV